MFQLLLENPSHRIPYIRMHFDQQPTCTEYLSVFPHLTELILDGNIKGHSEFSYTVPYLDWLHNEHAQISLN